MEKPTPIVLATDQSATLDRGVRDRV